MSHIRTIRLFFLLVMFALGGCASYKSQEVPFRPPAAYAGMQLVAGAQVAAEAYADSAVARENFGFDIRGAGILPVQVIIDNVGIHPLLIVPDQTFLIDSEGRYWNVLDNRTAYERLETSSEFGEIAKGVGKGSFIGAAGGALLGAAIGIVAGENVGTAAAKGAALGAAGGAVIGGTQSGTSGDAGRQISRDLANKHLENRSIAAGTLGRGFLFFPAEATSARELRVQFREVDTGQLHSLVLPL
ncbi:hypothetical protein [Trichloromonas sp.]|uniref:hypothetical protein n=1 Tax=Trichloromonas sp. TaxID=3069249 RepID=UPI002A3F6872|nr:hypothetical protein [Trichloromonas sp.]